MTINTTIVQTVSMMDLLQDMGIDYDDFYPHIDHWTFGDTDYSLVHYETFASALWNYYADEPGREDSSIDHVIRDIELRVYGRRDALSRQSLYVDLES